MNARPNILFVSENPIGCSYFLNHLGRAGCLPVIASDIEDAGRLLLTDMGIDLVLIQHETIAGACVISAGLKFLCPLMPVMLLTVEWPKNGLLPHGVDAVCCANSLGRRAARDIARFVRYLLVEEPNRLLNNPRYADGHFVPQKPTYLN